jgi:hypothetical protein
MELKTGLWIIGIVLAFVIIGNLLPDEEPTIPSKVIKEEVSEEIIDNFPNISEVHWVHMPLKYKFENECIGRQLNLTRLAFKKVELETFGVISFIETPEEPDISIYCKPSQYNRSGEYAIADAFYTLSPNSENLIEKGEINIYGQGSICNTGYPVLEVHEILHLFDIPHNPLIRSIMHPYSAESSSKCKITKIDEEYVSCLRYIYSNRKFNGSCSFPSYIHEDPSEYECEEGWFEVEGTDFCCPEPNMEIVDGYCESLLG